MTRLAEKVCAIKILAARTPRGAAYERLREHRVEFCGEWTAIHDHMPGKPETLRVQGCVCFNDGTWTAELVEHDGPQGFNPRMWMIDLVASQSEVGPDVLTEVSVQYERQTSSEYDQVQVVARDGTGANKVIDVEEVSRGD